MDKQLRRLVVAWILRDGQGPFADQNLVGLCELLAGRREEKLQAEFDKMMTTVEHLVFPDLGYHIAYNTDRDAEVDQQLIAAGRVMERHQGAFGKLT